MMRKKKVDVIVENRLFLTVCRVLLSFVVFVLLLGILWSGGNMRTGEYAILTALIISSSFGVYVSRGNNNSKESPYEKIIFIIGVFAILIGLVLDAVGVLESPGAFLLLVLAVLHVAVYGRVWRRELKKIGK